MMVPGKPGCGQEKSNCLPPLSEGSGAFGLAGATLAAGLIALVVGAAADADDDADEDAAAPLDARAPTRARAAGVLAAGFGAAAGWGLATIFNVVPSSESVAAGTF